MYRGWYKGHREFGSAVAPWEFCVAEWNAQSLGRRAYQITEAEKENLRWEAEQFRQGRAWRRMDYPHNLRLAMAFEDVFRVLAMQVTETIAPSAPGETPPLPRRGIPGTTGMRPPHERGSDNLPLEVDWEHLQRPGPRPAYVHEEEAREQLAYHPSDYKPTLVAEALYRNYMPLLAYIGGKPAAFTSKDHNFLPGEDRREATHPHQQLPPGGDGRLRVVIRHSPARQWHGEGHRSARRPEAPSPEVGIAGGSCPQAIRRAGHREVQQWRNPKGFLRD